MHHGALQMNVCSCFQEGYDGHWTKLRRTVKECVYLMEGVQHRRRRKNNKMDQMDQNEEVTGKQQSSLRW